MMNSQLLESQAIWSYVIAIIDVDICKVTHIGRQNLNGSQAWLGSWGKTDLSIALKGW